MEWQQIATWAALLGSALVAGIFFAFSTFVMGALGQIPAHQGIAAMQAINVTVLNPLFFGAFFGTGVVALVSMFLPGAAFASEPFLLAATILYLVGCIGVTIVFNVPLNNRLERVDPSTDEAHALWAHYLRRWTLWNSVRTAASFAAAVVFAIALSG